VHRRFDSSSPSGRSRSKCRGIGRHSQPVLFRIHSPGWEHPPTLARLQLSFSHISLIVSSAATATPKAALGGSFSRTMCACATDHADKLVTTGVFAFSRNPIYVAFGCVLLGQFLVFPDWILLVGPDCHRRRTESCSPSCFACTG
jgi:hypothetical protein